MSSTNNTFWTLIEDEYYRIYNGELKYAPLCTNTQSVNTNEESNMEVISPDKLELINLEFGSNFIIDDFR